MKPVPKSDLELLERLEKNFENLKYIQAIYLRLGKIIEENKELQRGNSFYSYLKFTFCVSAGATIRKIIMETKGSDSIEKLIKNIGDTKLGDDFEILKKEVAPIIGYVNKHWVHLDPNPPKKLTTLKDIYAAIDEIEKILKKLIKKLRKETRVHFNIISDDWENLFTFPWINSQ